MYKEHAKIYIKTLTKELKIFRVIRNKLNSCSNFNKEEFEIISNFIEIKCINIINDIELMKAVIKND